MHQIWYVSSTLHPEQAYCPKISKFIIQDGRRPPYWNLQKLEYLPNRSSDSHQIWHGASSWHHSDTGGVKTAIFQNPRWPPRKKLKFTKNWITSRQFVVYEPNLVCIIRFAPGTSLWSQNVEIHNPRWPPAAILKFTKTWISPEPFVRF